MTGTKPATDRKASGGGLPFAIGEQHMSPSHRRPLRDVLAAVIIGGPIGAALFGLLGGNDAATATVRAPAAQVSVTAPQVLRSGNWFEVEVEVAPSADVPDLTIAIDRALWRRLSVDTMVPDAESAESLDGRYRYHFGPVKRGETFVLKIDGQIQPDGMRRLQGRVTAGDGERPLADVPIGITVLP